MFRTGGKVRKVKSDQTDSLKIAKHGLDHWVDFVTTFWHCDCISQVSEKTFVERYQNGVSVRATISLLQKPLISTPTVLGTSLLCRRTTIPSC